MSKILLKHIPTAYKIPLATLTNGLQQFIITKPTMFGGKDYRYTYAGLLTHPDWVQEDWDYTERLTFNELHILKAIVDRDLIQRGMLESPLYNKINKLLAIEWERIKYEPNYDKYTDGSDDLL